MDSFLLGGQSAHVLPLALLALLIVILFLLGCVSAVVLPKNNMFQDRLGTDAQPPHYGSSTSYFMLSPRSRAQFCLRKRLTLHRHLMAKAQKPVNFLAGTTAG